MALTALTAMTGLSAIMGVGSAPALGVTLDAPISASLASKTQLAFGFDRLVEGYSGNTVQLQRSSDSATQDFGVDSNGIFDLASAITWAGGSDASVVKFYDQKGTGKQLLVKTWSAAASTLPFIVSGAVTRLASSLNKTNGALTLSTTQGGVSCDISGGKYLELTSSGLAASNGMTIHMLMASQQRKKAANNTTDPAGLSANATGEAYCSYGLATTNSFSLEATGGNYLHRVRRIATTAGGTDQQITGGAHVIKANSLQIASVYTNGTNTGVYAFGKQYLNATTSAGNATANNTFSNGTFRVGRRYPGSTGESTTYANIYFGGVIITETLSDFERFKVQARLKQVAYQHRRKSVQAGILDNVDDIVDWREVNAGTGVVTGKKGNVSFTINTATTIGSDTPDWDLDDPCADWGLSGLRSNDTTNLANGFIASTNYFMDAFKGCLFNLERRTSPGNNLCQIVSSGSNTTIGGLKATTGTNDDWGIAQGYHHAEPNFYGRVYETVDTTDKTGTTAWGDKALDQARGKYLFNVPHSGPDHADGSISTAGTVVSEGGTYPPGTTVTWALMASDLGITPPTPEGATYDFTGGYFADDSVLQMQYGAFDNGEDYDPNSPVAADMRTGTKRSYAPAFGTATVGGMDFSYSAQEGEASCIHNDPNGRLQSMPYLSMYEGVRLLTGFIKDAMPDDDTIEEIDVNWYKIYTEGWPS